MPPKLGGYAVGGIGPVVGFWPAGFGWAGITGAEMANEDVGDATCASFEELLCWHALL